MPRTTEALSMVAADVWVSQDGVTWIDLSPYGTTVSVSGGDRRTGEINVFDDERPIVRAGKKASQDITIRYAYTEEVDGPFINLRNWDETEGGQIFVRYWPAGAEAGNFVFETFPFGIITTFLDPGGEAGAGDPILCEITVKTEEIRKAVWVS